MSEAKKEHYIYLTSADGRSTKIRIDDPITFFEQNCSFLYEQAQKSFDYKSDSLSLMWMP